MESEVFSGRSCEVRKETPWLSSEDILDVAPVGVEVEAVLFNRDAIFDGGRKDNGLSLKFRGKTKQLWLNATNRKMMVDITGTTIAAKWAGTRIELYVQHGVQKPGGKKGEKTTGIRIRPVSNS